MILPRVQWPRGRAGASIWPQEPCDVTSLDAARSAAKRLKAATDGMGRPQKLTCCQAIVATACGHNGWQHLAKTLGTPHAPGDDRDKDLALRRFGETMRPLLPATPASDIPGLFCTTFGHGTGAGSADLDARLSAAVRELPPSPGLGRGLPVFGLDSLAGEDGRIRTSFIPLAMQDGAQGTVELEVATAEGTADSPCRCARCAPGCAATARRSASHR